MSSERKKVFELNSNELLSFINSCVFDDKDIIYEIVSKNNLSGYSLYLLDMNTLTNEIKVSSFTNKCSFIRFQNEILSRECI